MEHIDIPETVATPKVGATAIESQFDNDLISKLDSQSLEEIVELKVSRFFSAIGTNYPDDLHKFIMSKAEKPLIKSLYERSGYNQVRTANILGINRNTLRTKLKSYGITKKYHGCDD